MKLLVVGSGGREHCLALKLQESPQVSKVYVAPGNAGTQQDCHNLAMDVMDFEGIAQAVQTHGIDLVVVGPEDPLCGGLADYLQARGVQVFGVNQECAQFEGSKEFTKKFLMRHEIATAAYQEFTDYDQAVTYLKDCRFPVVIKADGLALGKGVIIAQDFEEGQEALQGFLVDQVFGEASATVIIEDYLVGEELSLICFVSHNDIYPLETARDYKRVGEGDQGENTGGVGGYSPMPYQGAASLEEGESLFANIQKLLDQISQGFKDDGFDYTGMLFVGFMNEGETPRVLEFNVRFGDPETQLLLPRLESDLVTLIQKTLDGSLQQEDIEWSKETTCGVVLFSKGYPGNDFERMTGIAPLPENTDKVQIIHNGTVRQGADLYANGGRVLTVVAKGDDLAQARDRAYEVVSNIQSDNLTYRRDIAEGAK